MSLKHLFCLKPPHEGQWFVFRRTWTFQRLLLKSALGKGSKFIPTQQKDIFKSTAELHHFFRKIKLAAHFWDPNSSCPNIMSGTEDTDFLDRIRRKKNKSRYTPEDGEYDAVDAFISDCASDLRALDLQHVVNKSPNLIREEKDALIQLRKRKDIYVHNADKGGAIVIWDRDLYFREGDIIHYPFWEVNLYIYCFASASSSHS